MRKSMPTITEAPPCEYRHTQRGRWHWLLLGLAVLYVVLAFALPLPTLPELFGGLAVLMVALAASFQHLTIADEGDHLAIRFGPLPLFQTRVRYEDIRGVEVARTTWLDGWGIHYSLSGGWVWNIAGRDCVVIRRPGILRVGTDDAEQLAAFLKRKLP